MKTLNKEEINTCDRIATRAMEMGLYPRNHRVTCFMDIENAAKFFNMKLEEWLNASALDFAHDVLGVENAIDRSVYPANFNNDPMFVPRFAGNYNN